MTKYVIVTSKDWFENCPKSNQFKKLNFTKIYKKNDLNIKNLKKINPKYIFFIHWNWKVNSNIYKNYNCVVFHTSPLPYGRGGSPIQNLIIRGIKKTPVCAIKMTNIIDGGPIYGAIDVTLDGTISEIFLRIAKNIDKLIVKICKDNLKPKQQKGDVIKFRRLKSEDNKLLNKYTIKELYDRIRMVDGKDYNKAYINFGKYKIEFFNSSVKNKKLYAKIMLYQSDN